MDIRSLLRIIEFLGPTTLRTVELEEIEQAAFAWAAYRGPARRGTVKADPSHAARRRFGMTAGILERESESGQGAIEVSVWRDARNVG